MQRTLKKPSDRVVRFALRTYEKSKNIQGDRGKSGYKPVDQLRAGIAHIQLGRGLNLVPTIAGEALIHASVIFCQLSHR